ncbi:MAG: hypothetical protein KBH11_04180 [Bacteroidia bacterium]|jgi:anaerobic ribonucleoside-triphosphate reductase|nr:hypothetical protein [Bacteroidota bacterium]MBL7915235.1 hypothetical protein [Bacteroidia bacterium]MBP9082249.1 hypothetical protein [Bacteroidia bacterium]
MKTLTKQQALPEFPTSLRTKCLVYTRVMGYHRPVESFNIGKKGEHKQRLHFREF